MSLDDYVKALVNEMGTDSGLIPAGVRLQKTRSNGYRYMLIEEPPTVRTLNYHGVAWDGHEHDAPPRLALPWMVYWIKFNQGNRIEALWPAFALSSIATKDQQLYRPCLPNIYTHTLVGFNYTCLGDTFRDNPTEPQAIIDAWWASEFNDDLGWLTLSIPISDQQRDAEHARLNSSQRIQRARLRAWTALSPDEIMDPKLHAAIGTVERLTSLA